jgi:predicted GNAT superfamily acetyltransferase
MMPDFDIRPLKALAEFHAAEDLQRAAWNSADIDIAPLHLMLTIAKNGGVVLGAFAGDQLIGFVLGFLGAIDQPGPVPARLKHCSHQMGVHPAWQSRGVGAALKRAQREAVLQQGVRLITWTYDPLESKNAHLNIAKLGAVCRTYIRDYYGELRDELNRGLATDRFQVEWWIASEHVAARLGQPRSARSIAPPVWNPARWDERGLPVCQDPNGPLPPAGLTLEFPADFQAVKRSDLALAIKWRLHVRQVCEAAFASGYAVVDYAYQSGPPARSFYVLQQTGAQVDWPG